MNGIFLLLGSNLGNRLENLRLAKSLLIKERIQILDQSSVYETEPWGKQTQPWFLNVILQIETLLAPFSLLETILGIEKRLGRTRKEKWGARVLDIDILYYRKEVIKNEKLTIPHARISNRKFTLILMAEMQPLKLHPILKKTQSELLAECTDPLDCRLTDYKL